jgi:hypothetical protein
MTFTYAFFQFSTRMKCFYIAELWDKSNCSTHHVKNERSLFILKYFVRYTQNSTIFYALLNANIDTDISLKRLIQ